jgi:DNA repair ATPase RecN
MKRQNEFPGLDNDQIEMLQAAFPPGRFENDFIYITGETGAGKTNMLNALFALLEKDDGKKFIELGDKFDNDQH